MQREISREIALELSERRCGGRRFEHPPRRSFPEPAAGALARVLRIGGVLPSSTRSPTSHAWLSLAPTLPAHLHAGDRRHAAQWLLRRACGSGAAVAMAASASPTSRHVSSRPVNSCASSPRVRVRAATRCGVRRLSLPRLRGEEQKTAISPVCTAVSPECSQFDAAMRHTRSTTFRSACACRQAKLFSTRREALATRPIESPARWVRRDRIALDRRRRAPARGLEIGLHFCSMRHAQGVTFPRALRAADATTASQLRADRARYYARSCRSRRLCTRLLRSKREGRPHEPTQTRPRCLHADGPSASRGPHGSLGWLAARGPRCHWF